MTGAACHHAVYCSGDHWGVWDSCAITERFAHLTQTPHGDGHHAGPPGSQSPHQEGNFSPTQTFVLGLGTQVELTQGDSNGRRTGPCPSAKGVGRNGMDLWGLYVPGHKDKGPEKRTRFSLRAVTSIQHDVCNLTSGW